MNTSLNVCEASIVQIPTQDNDFHAICIVRIVSSGGQSFSAIGEAFGDVNTPGESLLQRAEQCACERAIERMKSHGGPVSSVQTPSSSSGWDATFGKTKRPVGGPITDRQKWLIGDTAAKNGKTLHDAEAISRELYNRPISQLTTKEVNPILDRLEM